MKQFERTTAGMRASRRARRPRLSCAAMAVALVGWSCFSVPPSHARVNPLVVIERQLHKANMLIVLDTSGSMTGVPGGQFANSTEVGVDCDNGTNCRNGGVLGVCRAWGKTCQSDDDCRHGYCQKDGSSMCTTINDCTQDPGVCSVPIKSCPESTKTQTGIGTQTLTSTQTATNTLTGINTQTAIVTQTGTTSQTTIITQTITNTQTGTVTVTGPNTQTTTKTQTGINTQTQTTTATATVTITGTITSTNTAYAWNWPPDNWHTNTFISNQYTMNGASATATSYVTATFNGTATKAFTATGTVTGTITSAGTAIIYMDKGAWYSTVSQTGTNIVPATVTASGTITRALSETWTYTGTTTATGTQTATGTKTATGTPTATTSQTSTGTQTATGTKTATSSQTATGTRTTTGTPTGTSVQTTSVTQTAIGTQTATDITCTVTNANCAKDTDCAVQTVSTCSATGAVCSGTSPCEALGTCKYTKLLCTNPGGACPSVGVCDHSATTICASASDCPPTSASGNCSLGGTPRNGCTANSDCPSYKTCSVTNDTCRIDTDCLAPSYGTCSVSGSKCNNSYLRCPSPQTCVFAAQTCTGTENMCSLASDTCTTKTDNTCTAVANTCSTPTNTCAVPPANNCIQPVSGTDVCVPSTNGTPGPIRMCLIAQTVCKKDSDCTTSGDACGPATSRAVIAKRAVTAVVNSNYKLLNFGLMTYYQNGYFPYHLNISGSTTVITVFEAFDKLASSHCWDNHSGPAHSCQINGTTMTLRDSPSSRYRVRSDWQTWIEMDADWCGQNCDMPGALGLGNFEGAYYQYTGTTGGTSTTMSTQPTYSGHDITVSGKNYSYYQPLNNYYNGGAAPPLDFPDCGSMCSATCGGRWDTQLAPFLSTKDDPALSQAAAAAITQAMSPAANGGLVFYWNTPTGCTLQNDVSKTINTSAYDYMNAVKNGNSGAGIPQDTLTCRDNFVLLITDGAANGPGDNGCDAAPCADPDPISAGCKCKSVLAAYNLYHNLGVKTFVVGLSGDVSAGPPRTINDNIARAGATDASGHGVAPFAYLAQNEDELNTALQMVIYNAVAGSYSTAPTSTSAGTQQATTVAEGKYALDSRMDFPAWKGHLMAYNLGGASPTLAWDAYQKLTATNWWQRKIYTWDGTNMVKIAVDPTTHAVTNKDALAAMGLGASAGEAESVARWLMGDPTYKNPAILGAIINSTPIDVASPGDVPEPGGHAFFLKYQNRPHLIYVGSSDGLLHAFFLENTTIGSTVFQAGSEAFAFLSPDMLPIVRQQYSQGGQKPDPYSHIFGLADSPKAKTLCVKNCSDAASAVWKTLLIMPEGYGGGNTFVLDVTAPLAATDIADPPVTVQWHTGYGTSASAYGNVLGNTISLPAFFLNKTAGMDDYRVTFASGYPITAGSTTQGRALITASAATGALLTTDTVAPAATCTQEYTALTDVATARDFARGQNDKLVAGYFGDTSGQLFRYAFGTGLTLDQALTCDHPLHFSPTVVQLDRDATTTAFGHEIFPVQVTNSNLDLDTTALPPSKMIFWKETAQTDSSGNVIAIVKDPSWGSGGQITLTVGNNNEICGVTQMDSNGAITCKTAMPITARPTSTPLGVLRADASGFQVMTMWYVPAVDGCSKGETYFTIHQVTASATGTVTQRFGADVAPEPVTSPVIVGGRIYLFGKDGPIEITNKVPDSITAGRAVPPNAGLGAFTRFSWSEVF